VYEVPNWTVPNWTALNTTTQSQKKKACLAQSCKDCALLRCYAAKSGNSALTFQDNLLVPVSRVKIFKKESRAREFTDTIFFGGYYPSSNFLTKQNVSEAGSVSVFRESST
jgi:hypothetical protein